MNDKNSTFRPRARLLQLLGDQLISSSRLAVFELVKNAYDADATKVNITINNPSSKHPTIVIRDDGHGMSEKVVRDIWLVIAHDHRERQFKEHKRSKKGRLPLGAKGLGRLSVHKLGNVIELVTRSKDEAEVVVSINWNSLMEHEFLEDAQVLVNEREPEVFTGGGTGTQLIVSDLRGTRWSRGEVRRLFRQISSISSPFGSGGKEDFQAVLKVPQHPEWINKLPKPDDILRRAPWYFHFSFDGVTFDWRYEFRRIPGIPLQSRSIGSNEQSLQLFPSEADDQDPRDALALKGRSKKLTADNEFIKGIGPIKGEFYAFDRSPKLLAHIPEPNFVRDFLDENGGVRVYTDGMRVYDYGEREDDWLGMDLKRVNNPTKNLSRNLVLGYVSLEKQSSYGLIEKSNREGFLENDAYARLKRLVQGAIQTLQTEREEDRKQIREFTTGKKDPDLRHLKEPVDKIRAIAKHKQLSGQIDPLLDSIEEQFAYLKTALVKSGTAGVGAAMIFHEIEQGINSIYRTLSDNDDLKAVADQAKEIMKLLDGFSELLRREKNHKISLLRVLKRAHDLTAIRFRHHNITFVCPDLEEGAKDIIVEGAFGPVLGAVINLIDNAIHWLNVSFPEENQAGKKLYLGIDREYDDGPLIVVADNGPGFSQSADERIRPFYSNRPGGMGMGLFYANMVMEMNGGELLFPDLSETDLSSSYSGAITGLYFGAQDKK
jgi:signal transduction histidine kinase